MKIKGNTFIVTGAASGLGLATAKMIVGNGGNAGMLDIDTFSGEKEEAELGKNARFIQADVRNENNILKAIEIVKNAFNGLNGVVNCAGIGPAERVAGKQGPHDLELFKKVVSINLTGTFNVTRLVAPVFQENVPDDNGERGIIISTSSIAAYDGQIGQAAYAASKGGIASMTLPVARELARFGIRVMTIAPGIFDTALVGGLSEEVRQSLAQQIPFPSRFGYPEEFAALVKHIIENPMLNGEVIRLDGALRMGPK
jgi:NAD(P)-dependent dehydrogenase (short-subunit alcohol dehydrogenase family)